MTEIIKLELNEVKERNNTGLSDLRKNLVRHSENIPEYSSLF